MNTLESIKNRLDKIPKQPPIEQWDPPLSGDIDIVIKSNGQWFHDGIKIERKALVALFFSILRREMDNHYYLVTPVEKWRIEVEQAAGLVVNMDIINSGTAQQSIIFLTNTDQQFALSEQYPLLITTDPQTQEPLPLLRLPQRLTAKLTRSVFYRLVEESVEHDQSLRVMSNKQWFILGNIAL